MGRKIDYSEFVKELDLRLKKYFDSQSNFLCCKKGCSTCCEKGDYPLSEVELEYLMQGFIALDNETKQIVQQNIKNMEKGGACPFLINHECSVYPYRPVVCRVHGLAYLLKNGMAKVPYCVNNGKNYSSVYSNGELLTEPVKEDLETTELIKEFNTPVKNLYEWLYK